MAEKQLKNKEKVLFSLKRSRKAFFLEYGCFLFLIVLLLFSFKQEMMMKPAVKMIIFGLAMASLASAEFSRMVLRYKITSEKITIIEGIIKQNKKHIYFHPLGFVTDINIKQSSAQRVLDYGTIFVTGSGAGINSFEIKDIDNPHEVLKVIEQLIEEHKMSKITKV